MATLVNHPTMWLRDDAAASLARFERDKGIVPLNDAGRTEEEQDNYIYRWDQGGKYNRPPYLYEPKRPARESAHVKDGGIAIDTSRYDWFESLCGPYGWYKPYDWDVVHFEYNPNRDQFRGGTAPNTGGYDGSVQKGVHGPNPFGIPYTGGLQVIARQYGYKGAYDQNWGDGVNSGSMQGFTDFLRARYGYSGNNVLGPQMWRAIQRWLQSTGRYNGDIDGVPGPRTRVGLLIADTENWAVRNNI